jgi:hypothetical protein
VLFWKLSGEAAGAEVGGDREGVYASGSQDVLKAAGATGVLMTTITFVVKAVAVCALPWLRMTGRGGQEHGTQTRGKYMRASDWRKEKGQAERDSLLMDA